MMVPMDGAAVVPTTITNYNSLVRSVDDVVGPAQPLASQSCRYDVSSLMLL